MLPRRRAARPVDDPRQPPRRLGQRRHRPVERHGGPAGRGAARRRAGARAAGGRSARIVYAGLGRRGAGPARLDRVGRDARRRAAREGRRLHQLRQQRPRLPRRRRLALAGAARQPGGARRARPAEGRERGRARCAPRDRRRARRRGAARTPRRERDLPHRRRWAPAPTTRRSCSTSASPRSTSASAARSDYGQYHSIYDSFDHYVRFMDPDFAYGVALAKTRRPARAAAREADVLPFEFTAARPTTVGRYVDEVAKLADDMREETEERNRRLERRASTRRSTTPDETLGGARAARSRCRTSTSRRCRTRPRGCSRAPQRLRRGAGRRGARQRRCRRRAASRSTPILLRDRARAHPPGGAARPPLVPPPGLRARLLHRLRRQDPARACARRSSSGAGRRPRSRSRSRPRCSRPSRAKSSGPPRRSLPLAEGRPALTSEP